MWPLIFLFFVVAAEAAAAAAAAVTAVDADTALEAAAAADVAASEAALPYFQGAGIQTRYILGAVIQYLTVSTFCYLSYD